MKREIGFKEGYRLLRKVDCDIFTSAFLAIVWKIRGDMIDDENTTVL